MRANVHYRKAACITLVLLAGCSINLTIETDYASQRDHGGNMTEEQQVEAKAESKADVDVKADLTK